MISRLLLVVKRARLDLHTAVSFLTTRVTTSTEPYWNKYEHTISYIKETLSLPLTFDFQSLSIYKWWIEASYSTYHNMKGQTVGTMTLDKGSV